MKDPKASSTVIRDARLEDACAIARIGAQVFDLSFGHAVEPHDMQHYLSESYTPETIAAEILDPEKDLLVATDGDGGPVIGFAQLTRGTGEPCVDHLQDMAELQRIYVSPDVHSRGVGFLLAEGIEQRARKSGIANLWLGVWEENHRAAKFYRNLGYTKVGDHDFLVGCTVQRDYIMVKQLQ